MFISFRPPGVGKSSVSKELAYSLTKSAVIEDMIYLMVKGLVAPWEDDGHYMDFYSGTISLVLPAITLGQEA